MENDFQNSLADTQVALITTLLKKIAVIWETNCSEPKNWENDAFFNRAVYSNICLHWYKAIKKTLIEILTRHSEQFSHNVR